MIFQMFTILYVRDIVEVQLHIFFNSRLQAIFKETAFPEYIQISLETINPANVNVCLYLCSFLRYFIYKIGSVFSLDSYT